MSELAWGCKIDLASRMRGLMESEVDKLLTERLSHHIGVSQRIPVSQPPCETLTDTDWKKRSWACAIPAAARNTLPRRGKDFQHLPVLDHPPGSIVFVYAAEVETRAVLFAVRGGRAHPHPDDMCEGLYPVLDQ